MIVFKSVNNEVWVFDMEWAPDAASGRRVYGLPADMADDAVIEFMYTQGGATPEQPRPFLKTVLCRIVSVSVLIRRVREEQVQLSLYSLPEPQDFSQPDEARLIARFLTGLGQYKPQLVGFGSRTADMIILLQRALAHGIQATEFCRRPAKPWEGIDYFGNNSDGHIDLKDHFGTWGKGSIPSLHELATVCGFPGKLDVQGDEVSRLFAAGRIDEIVAYNECDTLTTYLVWLQAAHLAGFVSTGQMQAEHQQLRQLIQERIRQGANHLQRFLTEWDRLSG